MPCPISVVFWMSHIPSPHKDSPKHAGSVATDVVVPLCIFAVSCILGNIL